MKYLLIASVIVGGGFGSASAEVESTDGDTMLVTMEVEVMVSAQSVVAHLAFDDDPPFTIPLLDRGGGTFGVTTELEAKNYVVVFEAVGPDGETSEPVSMMQMGVDLDPDSGGSTTTTTDDGDISPENQRMLWLAVAAGAASLSVLAFWVLGPKEGKDEEPTGADEEE